MLSLHGEMERQHQPQITDDQLWHLSWQISVYDLDVAAHRVPFVVLCDENHQSIPSLISKVQFGFSPFTWANSVYSFSFWLSKYKSMLFKAESQVVIN